MYPFAAEQRQLCRGPVLPQMDALREWLPLGFDAEAAHLIWRWLGEKRCTEPFFADAWRAQESAQRRICHTDLSASQALRHDLSPVPIKAVIFHSSRCGSTLLMQMLACLPECIALSEPPVLEACLHYLHRCAAPLVSAKQWLPLLFAGLSQQRFAQEQFCVIKLDSWHLCDLPLLRAALPETAFYFLYRQPQAVLASHQRQRGPQMVPGLLEPIRLGIRAEIPYANPHAWGEMFLMRLFNLAQQYAESAEVDLLNYQELPALLWNKLLPAWQIDISEPQLQQIQQRSHFHAKNLAGFTGDPPGQALANPELIAQYEVLEKIRAEKRSFSRLTPRTLLP